MSNEGDVTDIDDNAARRFASLARTIEPDDRRRIAPPADLWNAIAGAVADDEASVATGDGLAEPRFKAAPSSVSLIGDRAHSPVEDRPGSSLTGGARVLSLQRRMTAVVLSAAAAIVVVLGVVALVAAGDDDGPAGNLLASGTLEALEEGFDGGVELLDVDGNLQVALQIGALPDAPDAYYELWLIKDLETGEMQSLGPIDGSGRVVLPQGLDPSEYATVDISVEPLDGDPTHSGQSVLRGELEV